MADLDFLEKQLLSTLSRCSIFSYSEIEFVYRKVNSFDKTIAVLKLAASGMLLKNAILDFMSNCDSKVSH
jgi:hypothetical protein